jgi:hypothetical protein
MGASGGGVVLVRDARTRHVGSARQALRPSSHHHRCAAWSPLRSTKPPLGMYEVQSNDPSRNRFTAASGCLPTTCLLGAVWPGTSIAECADVRSRGARPARLNIPTGQPPDGRERRRRCARQGRADTSCGQRAPCTAPLLPPPPLRGMVSAALDQTAARDVPDPVEPTPPGIDSRQPPAACLHSTRSRVSSAPSQRISRSARFGPFACL